jgi:hydrogenase-1 operon protein HyaE
MTPLDDLVRLSGRGFLDETDGRAFLAETGPRVLVFPGVEKRRPEAQDVAVIIREFHRLYQGAFEFAVLSGHAEDRLKSGLGVVVLPSAVLLGAGPPRVVPRVQDWRVYAQAFHESFGPARRAAAE